jgi:DNA polymerase III delta prime subunit
MQDDQENGDFETRYESQVSLFEQFLFKSSRYLTDQIFDTNSDRRAKILFVKEIPNFANRDPAAFQKLLRQFKLYSKYSIIFSIQTVQSANSDSNPHRLFTADIRRELGILELSFNAIANTYLAKHIDRICKLEGLVNVDKKMIENLCASCNGDLRHAVNMLELVKAEQNSSSKKLLSAKMLAATSGVKRKAAGKSSMVESTSEILKNQNYFEHNLKDPSYNIFRGKFKQFTCFLHAYLLK